MLSDCTGEAIVPGRYLNQLIDYPLLKLLKDFFSNVFSLQRANMLERLNLTF